MKNFLSYLTPIINSVNLTFIENYKGHCLLRCPASNTFPSVVVFINSNKNEAVLEIFPSHKYLDKPKSEQKSNPRVCKQAPNKWVNYRKDKISKHNNSIFKF